MTHDAAKDAPISRYHRQELLDAVGAAGQSRLRSASVLIVGCGALGCAAADQLVRAGVGRVTIVDRDVVELTNLQRQTLFDEADVGDPKAHAAHRRLARVNSSVALRAIVADLNPDNAESIFAEAGQPGVLVDGTDNFEARLLLNDLSVKHAVPMSYGGVVGTRGVAALLIPGRTPCLRCLVAGPPRPGSMETCDTAGVLGPAALIVAARQAADAIWVLAGRSGEIAPALRSFDLWTGRDQSMALPGPDPECPTCSGRRFDALDGREQGAAEILCGENAVQVRPARGGAGAAIDLSGLAEHLARHGRVTRSAFLVRAELDGGDGADPIGLTIFSDGRAIIRGAGSADRARAVYARYVGA